jgi:hypothetical protein
MSRDLTALYFRLRLRSQGPPETSSFILARRSEFVAFMRNRSFDSLVLKTLISIDSRAALATCESCGQTPNTRSRYSCVLCTRSFCGHCTNVSKFFVHAEQPAPVDIRACAACLRFLHLAVHRHIRRTSIAEAAVLAVLEDAKERVISLRQKRTNIAGVQRMPELEDLLSELEQGYRKDKETLQRVLRDLNAFQVAGVMGVVRRNIVTWLMDVLTA